MPRARLIRSIALVAALATVPIGLVACTGAPAAPASPDGLAVSLRQGRLDVVERRLVVRFENTGAEPVAIEGFTVETPTLEPGLERSKPFELAAGDAIAVRLDLPGSACDAEPGPVVVDVAFRTTGVDGEARLTADDPFDTISRVNAADCLGESVAEVAEIVMPEHLRSTGTGAGRRAFIDVEIVPAASAREAQGGAGAASMRIERVYGTTLLSAEDGVDWPLGLDVAAGDPPLTISLPVRPARCDAHAIADDKRGTILPFEVETSDGSAGRLDVPSDDGLKAELYAYYVERCGLATPPAG
ncbi:hypothetical protein ACFWN7_04910 [Agromyces sp. NPDC058484]|uniref:hypothetical protein n=1 Tax=Agromyces sp. NPDC058484 TaxID=3346524 RepID=UPI0036680AF4